MMWQPADYKLSDMLGIAGATIGIIIAGAILMGNLSARANLLAMQAILQYDPDAIFIQSESSEYTHPSGPAMLPLAGFENERRFIPLDLTYGHDVSASIYRYLIAHGMTAADYDFFMNQTYRFRC